MALEPPPEQEFDDEEVAEEFIHSHARNHGYALSKSRSRSDKKKPPTIHRIDFRCDKGSTVRGHGVTRNTGSRMTECPFEVRLMRTSSGTWKVTVVDSNHNHQPSEDTRQHTAYRKPTKHENDRIDQLTQAGLAPKFIVSALHTENPQTLVGSKEVYNHKVKQKKQQLGDLTPVEALVDEFIKDDNWALRYTTDAAGHINLLFFSYGPAIEITQSSPDIILIDATYRTNRYNMPLLHFMGVTPISTSFSIA